MADGRGTWVAVCRVGCGSGACVCRLSWIGWGGPGKCVGDEPYIQADYSLQRVMVALIGPAEAKVHHLTGELAAQCPDVGAGAPEDEASQPVSALVADALWSVAYGTAVGPIRAFRAKVLRLSWSNHAITRAADAYANNLYELATIPAPPLCSDIAAWRASGFSVIAPAASALVQRVEAIEPKPVPAGLLAPYEHGADASTLARATRLEAKVGENEFVVGQSDWDTALTTLGLNQ